VAMAYSNGNGDGAASTSRRGGGMAERQSVRV
jgi:hypothetical protein